MPTDVSVTPQDLDVSLTELHNAAKAYAQAADAFGRAAESLAQAAHDAYGDQSHLISPFDGHHICFCITRAPAGSPRLASADSEESSLGEG